MRYFGDFSAIRRLLGLRTANNSDVVERAMWRYWGQINLRLEYSFSRLWSNEPYMAYSAHAAGSRRSGPYRKIAPQSKIWHMIVKPCRNTQHCLCCVFVSYQLYSKSSIIQSIKFKLVSVKLSAIIFQKSHWPSQPNRRESRI